ncbi:hypothetical protein [Vannielia litorea]|uniref:Tetratricopeptide repeat-containing protein n=1 Tax=Vannielia litorea TaxID=1217970 RepID=A0A1N6E7S4_9RHOB|nr:hypothetical protein [Vannielia litorea]SIN79078.1 hypothetical protein SAMN05444002_0434 [Vannielia litorea]
MRRLILALLALVTPAAAPADPASFAARFAVLKRQLDDPEALFIGGEMVAALLALEPLVTGPAEEARLFRELAVVEGKRDEAACLDHAERALAAEARAGVLAPLELYFMHRLCAETGVMWVNDSRTTAHLEAALALAPQVGRPVTEIHWLRMNQGTHLRALDKARHKAGQAPLHRFGLEAWEPLLGDATAHYGAESSELSDLLRLMSEAYELEGDFEKAIAVKTRSVALTHTTADPGRRVSALTGLAALQHRAGKVEAARATFDAAIDWAEACCSTATRGFARDQKARLFP